VDTKSRFQEGQRVACEVLWEVFYDFLDDQYKKILIPSLHERRIWKDLRERLIEAVPYGPKGGYDFDTGRRL
jgi:hypothetical protein